MPGVLEGIKVIDLASMWATPLAGAYLGDQGAEVIKIEPPWGDQARSTFTTPPMPNGLSRSWVIAGRGKRGLAVNIAKPDGKVIIHKLVKISDVILTNFRPVVAARLGYDYKSLKILNPGLIYARVSAFGDNGPYANDRGYDRLFQALSGMMSQSNPEDIPRGAGIWAADMSAPWALCYGIALALIHREKSGEGQEVNTALLHMSLAMQAVDLVRSEEEVTSSSDPTENLSNQALYLPYQCSEGKWINIVVISDKEFISLCEALEIPDAIKDPRFLTSLDRTRNSEVLYQVLSGIFQTRTLAEWLQCLKCHDVPCAQVLSRNEVFDSPQVKENNLMVETAYPGVGKVTMVNTPIRLSKKPVNNTSNAPLIGEHTNEILNELGYTQEKINELVDSNVVLQA